MTPNEIATSIGGLKPAGGGDINWSTTATFCISGGQTGIADDQSTWD